MFSSQFNSLGELGEGVLCSMVRWKNPRESQGCKTWNHARRVWTVFSTFFPWVIDAGGERDIKSKGIFESGRLRRNKGFEKLK